MAPTHLPAACLRRDYCGQRKDTAHDFLTAGFSELFRCWCLISVINDENSLQASYQKCALLGEPTDKHLVSHLPRIQLDEIAKNETRTCKKKHGTYSLIHSLVLALSHTLTAESAAWQQKKEQKADNSGFLVQSREGGFSLRQGPLSSATFDFILALTGTAVTGSIDCCNFNLYKILL